MFSAVWWWCTRHQVDAHQVSRVLVHSRDSHIRELRKLLRSQMMMVNTQCFMEKSDMINYWTLESIVELTSSNYPLKQLHEISSDKKKRAK